MGVSFQTFRRRARVAYAATMLITTNLPTEAIAERAAFSDASHLHRSFVQEYGCTPGQYRDQAQAGARRGEET
jgi:AraC-like DNA-binding protein